MQPPPSDLKHSTSGTPFQSAHDLAERDRIGRSSEGKTAAGAPAGGDEAVRTEIADHLDEVMARDAQLTRQLVRREQSVGLAGRTHERTQGEIGELGQPHPFSIDDAPSATPHRRAVAPVGRPIMPC